METSNNVIAKVWKALLVFLLGIGAQLYSCSVLAQKRPVSGKEFYMGFGATFGIKSQQVKSNLNTLNQMKLMQEGGTIIATYGNNVLRSKLETGFYYSSSSVSQTINLVEVSGAVNFYPLAMIKSLSNQWQPYTVFAASRAQQKFYGFYGADGKNEAQQTQINYSVAQAPYLGKMVTSQLAVGLGIEYTLRDNYDFIHLFAEARSSNPFNKNSSALFADTFLKNNLAFSVGVVFGRHR